MLVVGLFGNNIMSFEWGKNSTKLQIYKNLFNNQFLADVKFIFPQRNVAEPKIIYSHSFLLSIHSPVFHKIFYGANESPFCKFNDYYELVIANANYSIFSEFICYFYTLEANRFSIKPYNRKRSNNLYSLLKLAHDYDVTMLENLILSYFDKHLKKNINFDTIVNTFLISNLLCDQYNATFQKSVAFIKRNLFKFLKHELASELDRAGLEIVLRFEEVDYWTNEFNIYEAVIGWAEKQNEFDHTAGNYREVLGERFMKLIRFPTMNYSQFKKVISGDVPQLLTENEIRRLFSYISNVSYDHANEMVDLCGYNYVPRRKIKQWKDYKLCQTFVPYNKSCGFGTWWTSLSFISVLQGTLYICQG